MGWTNSPRPGVFVGGIEATASAFNLSDGRVIAALDDDGNLGITGKISSGDVTTTGDEPTSKASLVGLGWGPPNNDVVISGVVGEVAICYNEEGAPVAAIDRSGRLGVYGLYIVDGVRLNAIPKSEGDPA